MRIIGRTPPGDFTVEVSPVIKESEYERD